jgi:hypothetical protein
MSRAENGHMNETTNSQQCVQCQCLHKYTSKLCTGSHILVVRTPASDSRRPGIEPRSRGRTVPAGSFIRPPHSRTNPYATVAPTTVRRTQPGRYTDCTTDRTVEEQWLYYQRGERIFHLKTAVFQDVGPFRYCVDRRFGGTYRLHLQGRTIRE